MEVYIHRPSNKEPAMAGKFKRFDDVDALCTDGVAQKLPVLTEEDLKPRPLTSEKMARAIHEMSDDRLKPRES